MGDRITRDSIFSKQRHPFRLFFTRDIEKVAFFFLVVTSDVHPLYGHMSALLTTTNLVDPLKYLTLGQRTVCDVQYFTKSVYI
jgi:hypothetical protein